MATKKRKFSSRPEAGEEGLFGNVHARIAAAKYGTYGEHGNERMIVGNRQPEDPCAIVEFEVEGHEPVEQFLSCGPATKLVPSEDGEEAASEGPFLCLAEGSNATGLSKNSRMWPFLNSLSKPPEGKLKFDSRPLDPPGPGLDALVGLEGFFIRVPAPRISSVAVEEGAREQTMLVCQSIDVLPGKAGTKKKAKPAEDEDEDEEVEKKFPKAVKKKAKAADEDEEEEEGDEVKDEAQGIVVKALAKAGDDGVKKDKLVKACFGEAAKSKNRKAILELLQDDEFIEDEEAPWQYDGREETLKSIE